MQKVHFELFTIPSQITSYKLKTDVLRTRSTELLSFAMCFANFTAGLLWFVYGYMINDVFIMVMKI